MDLSNSVQRVTNLKLKPQTFKVQFLIDSLESFYPLICGNVNPASSMLHPLGLVYLLIVLLCSPCLASRFSSVLNVRRESQSLIVTTLIKMLFPIFRSEGQYTVGGELTLLGIKAHLDLLLLELLEAKAPPYGALSDPRAFQNFKTAVRKPLISLRDVVEDKDMFVSISLSILRDAHGLIQVPRSDWEDLQPFLNTVTPNDSVLGIRKLFRVSDSAIGSGSDMPLMEKVDLFQVLVEQTEVTMFDTVSVLCVPTSGCVVTMFLPERVSDTLFRVNRALQIKQPFNAPKQPRNQRPVKQAPAPNPVLQPGARPYCSGRDLDPITFCVVANGNRNFFNTIEEALVFSKTYRARDLPRGPDG
jgi:hypothetical protein